MNAAALTRTRDFIQREARIPFAKQIDLYSVEEDILIGVSGSVGKGFLIEPCDLLLQSDDMISDYEQRMRKLLNALPEGVVLHFVVRAEEHSGFILQDYEDSISVQDEVTRRFVESKIRSWRRHPFFNKETYLFVCLYPPLKKQRSAWMPQVSLAFGRKAHQLASLEFEKVKESLQAVSNEVLEGLQALGFSVRPLNKKESLGHLYRFLNPAQSESAPAVEKFIKADSAPFERSSLRSRLLLNLPRSDYDAFYLDGFYHQAINLSGLPESTTIKSLGDFEKDLGRDYFLSLTLEVPEQERERAWIQRQGNFARAKNFFSRSPDHDAIAKAGEADEFLSELAETWDKVLYASLAVLVKDKTREGVSEKAGNTLRAFRRLGGAEGISDHMNHDRLFLTFLPLQGGENPLTFPVASQAAVHLLPLQGRWRGTGDAGLFLKSWRDERLRLDLFDARLQAKHAVMLGATGAGKSFFASHLLAQFLTASRDHDVVVIDLGGSYRKMAAAFGGSYLEVECSENYALNPFPSKAVLFPEGGESDGTFIQFLKELLQKMIDPTRVWASSEKMILEKAIWEVYRALQGHEVPLLGDVETQLRDFKSGDEEDRRKAYQFAKELSLFTQGEYGKILNRKGRFDFNARFTVFDLRKVSRYPELQEVLLFIIPFALKRKFENLQLKKLLVLDECWQLLKESQGTDLVEVFYRTARKLNAGVLSISQNPEDFLDASIASVIVNNSPVKYVLRLKKGHEKLALFGLNENEIQAARELEVKPGFHSEVFIKFDDRGVVAKIEPSPLEYWLATTDPADLSQEIKLGAAHPDFEVLDVLEALARQFPNGVGKSGGIEHA